MHVTIELNEHYTQCLLKLQQQLNRPLAEIVTQLVEQALGENSFSIETMQSTENRSTSADETLSAQAKSTLHPSVIAAFNASVEEFDSLYRELAK